jgi:hypothetical protein
MLLRTVMRCALGCLRHGIALPFRMKTRYKRGVPRYEVDP